MFIQSQKWGRKEDEEKEWRDGAPKRWLTGHEALALQAQAWVQTLAHREARHGDAHL